MDDREDNYRQAAASCLELAKTTTDEKARATLLAMAQKLLDMATSASCRGFNAILAMFNDEQMRKQ